MAAIGEYIAHGDAVNKAIEAYQINDRMLPGQVFEILEKRLVKDLLQEIAKTKAQTVRFVDVEAILSGPHRVFSYAIFGGLAELIDELHKMEITVTGVLRHPENLPWNFVSRIDKSFKGIPPHPSST